MDGCDDDGVAKGACACAENGKIQKTPFWSMRLKS